ncbi:hypothetical protein VUR80DRAFT_7478 [Thermomyces stellatus]
MASQPQPQTNHAPATQTQTVAAPEQSPAPPAPILRLRGAHTSRRRVQWTEDVVDNEKLNRKKSKVCCIYHRPKAVDESSDESSSSSSSDSDSGSDERPNPKDFHGDDCPGHDHSHRRRGRPRKRRGDGKKENRKPSPNAYERMPKVKTRVTAGEDGGGESNTKA